MYTKESQYVIDDMMFVPPEFTEKDFFRKARSLMVKSSMTAEEIVDSYIPGVNSYGICVPFYFFSFRYSMRVDYTAVYIEEKHLPESVEKKDHEGKTIVVSEIRTKEEKKYHPISDDVSNVSEAIHIATDLKRSIEPAIISTAVESFVKNYEIPLDQLQKYTGNLKGFREIPFSYKPHEFIDLFDKEIDRKLLKGVKLRGHRQMDLSIRDLQPERFRCTGIYVPFRIHTYDHNGKQYIFLMNCYNGKTYNNGRPRDSTSDNKYAVAFAGIYLGVLGLILCTLILYSFFVGFVTSGDWIGILENAFVEYKQTALILPLIIGWIYVSHKKSNIRKRKEKEVDEYFRNRGISRP